MRITDENICDEIEKAICEQEDSIVRLSKMIKDTVFLRIFKEFSVDNKEGVIIKLPYNFICIDYAEKFEEKLNESCIRYIGFRTYERKIGNKRYIEFRV